MYGGDNALAAKIFAAAGDLFRFAALSTFPVRGEGFSVRRRQCACGKVAAYKLPQSALRAASSLGEGAYLLVLCGTLKMSKV